MLVGLVMIGIEFEEGSLIALAMVISAGVLGIFQLLMTWLFLFWIRLWHQCRVKVG